MKENMEDGEIELSDHVLLSNTVPSTNFQDSTSVDLIIDEYLKNTRTCTHTHTCNPPGPDVAHHIHATIRIPNFLHLKMMITTTIKPALV
ncbi:hypothetical protein ERO13_A05G334201v2 [Gossypium hirsutum]|nr:hypothetical protein ERO13_A05G334201v2 [Gossypium hirsutum]